MKIHNSQEAINREKSDGTFINYFLFDEYELHENTIPPHIIQPWHHHEKIHEVLYLINGELLIKWRENGVELSESIKSGDVVEMDKTPHTLENQSDQIVRFLIIKIILKGENNRELFKSDKLLD